MREHRGLDLVLWAKRLRTDRCDGSGGPAERARDRTPRLSPGRRAPRARRGGAPCLRASRGGPQRPPAVVLGRQPRRPDRPEDDSKKLSIPTRVVHPESRAFVDVGPGDEHTCALDERGEVWCWGADMDGQLGRAGDLEAALQDRWRQHSCHALPSRWPRAPGTPARSTSREMPGAGAAASPDSSETTPTRARARPCGSNAARRPPPSDRSSPAPRAAARSMTRTRCGVGVATNPISSGKTPRAGSSRPAKSRSLTPHECSISSWRRRMGARGPRRSMCTAGALASTGSSEAAPTPTRSCAGARLGSTGSMPPRSRRWPWGLSTPARSPRAVRSVTLGGHRANGRFGDEAAAFAKPSKYTQSMDPDDAIMSDALVALGAYHTCLFTNSKEAMCAGSNHFAQLGTGDRQLRRNPHTTGNLEQARALAAGQHHTCARLAQSIKCWGRNGLGAVNPVSTPGLETNAVERYAGADVTPLDLTAGRHHTCAILEREAQTSIECWGTSTNGQFGPNISMSATTQPITLMGQLPSRLDAHHDTTCALLTSPMGDSSIQCWGGSVASWGEPNLGSGDPGAFLVGPIRTSGASPYVDLALGGRHVCVLDEQGVIECWGGNAHGQLGVPRYAQSVASEYACDADDPRTRTSRPSPRVKRTPARYLAPATRPTTRSGVGGTTASAKLARTR